MSRWLSCLAFLVAVALGAGAAEAQSLDSEVAVPPPASNLREAQELVSTPPGILPAGVFGAAREAAAEVVAPANQIRAQGDSPQSLSTAVEIAVLLTALSLLPAALITMTSFTRIVIVLSFVRRALGTNELPPTPVIIGLALFLTTFVMSPTLMRVSEAAWTPYQEGELSAQDAGKAAWGELSGFLLANTRRSELALFSELANEPTPAVDDPSARVIVPAFVLSELKTAFQMGFLLFLPFLVIDLVVSSVLLSMGMFMLPPVMISTPFKILLFVLVDGWHLITQSVVTSFAAV